MDTVTQLKNAIDFAKKNPDAPQSIQLRKRIESGMYNNELKQIQSQPVEQKKSIVSKVASKLEKVPGTIGAIAKTASIIDESAPTIKQYAKDVAGQYQKAGQNITEAVQPGQNPLSAGLQTAGNVAGAAFAPITEIPVVKKATESIGKSISDNPILHSIIQSASKLAQEHPEASKNIESAVNLLTLGSGKAIEKPIQNIVTDSAKSVASGTKSLTKTVAKKAGSLIPKSEEIMNRVARLTPKEANNFTKLSGGISHGEYLTKTGNFGTPDQIISKEAEKFAQSINDVDTEIAKLPGLYKNGGVDDMLSGLLEKAKSTSGENIKSPYLQQVMELQQKNAVDGLTMEEINAIKRLYERNVKLGYNKLVNGDKVEQATNIDNAVREWQVKQAERLGFTNLPELNKQTQLSKFIVNKLGDQVVGKTGLNNIGLTDWIMLSGGDPTAVGGFLTKKFFSSKGVQSRIAKMLSKTEPIGQVKPKTTPINYNPLQLPEPAIRMKSAKDSSSIRIVPAEKNKTTMNPKTGKFQKSYSSTASKQQ